MASNITKNFDQRKKFGLRMATGGIVDQMNNLANLSNTDRYKLGMSGTAAEASTLQERAGILSGLQTAAPAAPAPAAPAPAAPAPAAPAPAVATQPVAKPYDHMATVQSRGKEIEALGSKLRSMQQAAPKVASSPLDAGSSMAPMPKVGLRAGGVVDPEQNEVYEIEGPGDGSGVDDNVDVNLHGKNIKVSKGERFAVFPASVPAEAIEDFIESQTGEPSATRTEKMGLRQGAMRAFGGYVDDYGNVIDKEANKFKTPVRQEILNQQMAKAGVDAQPYAQRPDVQATARNSRPNFISGANGTSSTSVNPRNLPAVIPQSGGTAMVPVSNVERVVGSGSAAPVAAASTPTANAARTGAYGVGYSAGKAVGDTLRAVAPHVNKATNVTAGLRGAYDTGKEGTALQFPELADDSTTNRLSAAAKALPIAAADVATSGMDAVGDILVSGANYFGMHPKGAPIEHGFINKAYRESLKKNISPDIVTVPTTEVRNPVEQPAPVVQSKGTPAVMTDSSDYGREGRIASAQRAVSLDQAKSGFDVPTDARVVTGDGTRMYVGQQKQDATELRPANGTGYITGAPDAKGLRKTIFLGGDQEKYTDVDGKPTTDWTKTQRYKDQIEINSRMAKLADTMERDRLGRDAFSPEIKDPRVQAAALAQLSRLDSRDDQRDVVGLRQQIIDTQKGVLDLSNRKLDEVIRHNKFTEGAAATRAKEARAEQAVKNLDALIADQGLSEADANAFRDFMRANYFGRKHMVKGKEVDVPGMEDMSSDQMRALMPDAVMRYKWNRDFNEASRTGTSQHEAKGLRNRKINWSDVSKGPTGLPDLFSTDSKGKIPVFGEGGWFESVTPDIFRNINDNVIEEVDANGNPIRVALARDINSDKTGSIDRSLYLKERGLK